MRGLIGKLGFNESDRDDLEQEVTLHVLKWLPRYDPAKSLRKTYLARLLDCKLANIVRHRRTRVRFGNAEVISIEVQYVVGSSAVKKQECQVIPDIDRHEIFIGRRNLSRQEEIELKLDLETILSSLPPTLREACQRLMHDDKAEVAREMGLPDATFYDQVIEPLREAFLKAGFDEIPASLARTRTTCG